MSEVLLRKISELHSGADSETKRRASKWLEDWRLQNEAWSVSQSILLDARTNTEVLFYCAETLALKMQQDFEELRPCEILRFRDNLIHLLLKFGGDQDHADVRTHIVLATATFCAHVDGSFWRPQTCIQWLVEKLTQESNSAAFNCLIELLEVIPGEAVYTRTGLHPERRTKYKQELKNEFLTMLEVFETNPNLVIANKTLQIVGNWFKLCDDEVFRTNLHRLKPFVDLAIEALQEADSNFSSAVNFVNELLHSIKHAATDDDNTEDFDMEEDEGDTEDVDDENDMEVDDDEVVLVPEVKEFLENLANAVLKLLPKFRELCQEEGKLEVLKGLAKLFCALGHEQEQLILAKSETSDALLDAIECVTSHPDHEVNGFAFEFWESFAYSVMVVDEKEYFSENYKNLIPLRLDQAKLSEDFLELTEDARMQINRNSLQYHFTCPVLVLGPDKVATNLLTKLIKQNKKLNAEQHWREIEALLFALRSISSQCKRCRDYTIRLLFNTLTGVPCLPVVQSAMLQCLDAYSHWLPTLAKLSRSDPLSHWLSVILRNLSTEDSATGAVKAFCGFCKSCALHLETYLPQLEQLYGGIKLATNVSSKSSEESALVIVVTKNEVLEILAALVNGVTQLERDQAVIPFLMKISEDLVQSIRSITQLSLTSDEFEEHMRIQIGLLRTFFKSCKKAQINSEIIKKVLNDLLHIADQASLSQVVIKEVSRCLKEAIKSSGGLCDNKFGSLIVSLSSLYAKSHHRGWFHISSEIVRVFGRNERLKRRINQSVSGLLTQAFERLQRPQDFNEDPELVVDAFSMAREVVKYIPDIFVSNETLFLQILDSAVTGILVHHEKACRSILKFIELVAADFHRVHPDFINNALTMNDRGSTIAKILLAGIAGAFAVLDRSLLSDVFYAISCWSEGQELELLAESLDMIPKPVLTPTEKQNYAEDFKAAIASESKGFFDRYVFDLDEICCRSRFTRSVAQRVLLPDELQDAATGTTN